MDGFDKYSSFDKEEAGISLDETLKKARTPTKILSHSPDYDNGSWREYELWEYGMWAYLLVKRATHRKDGNKREKDLKDAANYWAMGKAVIDKEIEDMKQEEKEAEAAEADRLTYSGL